MIIKSFELFESIEPLVSFSELEKITQNVRDILVDVEYIPCKVEFVFLRLPQILVEIGPDKEYKIKIDDYIEELRTIDQYLRSEDFKLSSINHTFSDLELAIGKLSGREMTAIRLWYELKKKLK